MADMIFEAFLWSLTMQESGGDYSARGRWVKGDRAYGRYQVMGANIPSWTKQYYGRSLTPQEFLRNPKAQDAVVRGKLKSYYDRYGAAGAAAMWYSGQPDPTKTYGNPPVFRYVQQVRDRMKQYSGQQIGYAEGSGGSTGKALAAPTYTTEAAVPKLDKWTLMERYGLTAAMINSNKEIKSLFNQAVEGQWDEDLFVAKLKNTKWWRTTSDSARKFFLMKTGDPATYRAKYAETMFKLNQMAVQVGMPSQILKGNKASDILNRAVLYAMRDGWSDARVKAYFGTQVRAVGGVMRGEAGEVYDQLFQLAYANGMSYSSSWFENNARSVVAGKATLEQHQATIRAQAAAKYSAFADQIRAGQNAMDLAQPYIGAVAQILELPATDIDLTNKYVLKAMTAKQKGSLTGTQYPLWQFENELRGDPLWRKTNNARESLFAVAHEVARNFGVAF